MNLNTKLSLFDRVTMVPHGPEPDTAALLDIPTFLLRGHPDNDRVLAEGAARLAANPPPKAPTRRDAEPENPDKAHPTQAMKRALVKLGWSAAQAERVNRAEAEFAISGNHGPGIRFTSKKLRDPDAPAGRGADSARRLLQPRKEKKEKKTRDCLLSPAYVITVLAAANPCRPGSAAHIVFEKYRTGMTVAEFDKAAGAVCPGKLRPIDYLVYDSRRGRIAIGPVELEKVKS